jgi:hypothetical protein
MSEKKYLLLPVILVAVTLAAGCTSSPVTSLNNSYADKMLTHFVSFGEDENIIYMNPPAPGISGC